LRSLIVTCLLLFVYIPALFGWGHIISKRLRISWPFPLITCLGLSVWIFLGGILNLLGIAYPIVLDCIVLFGLGYCVLVIFRSFQSVNYSEYLKHYCSKERLIHYLPSVIVILIACIFVAHTLASPKVFNVHDDLQKYLYYPIRMLATGTLRGSPLSLLGFETIGGQPFLHGFIAAHWPTSYINTVDAVFAFILCLMCIISATNCLKLSCWFTLIAVLFPILIPPQHVNISSIYTSSALLLLLFLGPLCDSNRSEKTILKSSNAVWMGLVYAGLVALKIVNLLFVAIHFFLLAGGLIYLFSWKNTKKWTFNLIKYSILFISPWILLYYSNGIAWLSKLIYPKNELLILGYNQSSFHLKNIFSIKPLTYAFGATYAHYTIVIILIGFYWATYLLTNKQTKNDQKLITFIACAGILIVYLVTTLILSYMLLDYNRALRYICPFIIAAVPSTIILTTANSADFFRLNRDRSSLSLLFILVLLSVVVLASFYGPFSRLVNQVYVHNTILSFRNNLAIDRTYINYTQYVLSGVALEEIRQAQKSIPENEPFIASTALTIHLDYQRNKIINIDYAGLSNPWVDFPFGKEPAEGVRFFSGLGARYILLEYRSFSVRSEKELKFNMTSPHLRTRIIATKEYLFSLMLKEIAKNSKILYDNGSIVVMKLP